MLSNEMLGLSRLQVTSVMSEFKTGDDRMGDYMIFAPSAARMMYTMVDLSSQVGPARHCSPRHRSHLKTRAWQILLATA
jgi:hypothetical protein